MEEIADQPLLLDSGHEEKKNEKHLGFKKHFVMCICVVTGLVVGILIGYFSFRNNGKTNSNKKRIQEKSFNNITTKGEMHQNIIDYLPMIIEITSMLGNEVIDLISSSSVSISQPEGGGDYWITYYDGQYITFNGQIMSLYYHPSKKHTATTKGKLGEKRSIAEPGHWAISYQTRDLWQNKVYYNVL